MQCVQSVINLLPEGLEGRGLLVYPGEHELMLVFFDTQTNGGTQDPLDRCLFDKGSWLGLLL